VRALHQNRASGSRRLRNAMRKEQAVAALGPSPLLQPARLRAALRANDRLKLYLTVLQAAAAHAASPERGVADLAREIAAADVAPRPLADWLRDLPGSATRRGDRLVLPDLPRLAGLLHDDLGAMARPLPEPDAADATERDLATRVAGWQAWLKTLAGPELASADLARLTRGQGGDDSLHRTVMDLHRALNRLAERIAGEDIDGAHGWQLAEDGSDRPLVAAFMRGVNRTRALKLDHPGLETAATRDGKRLLIQNDIGTNDVHVLVLQVEGLRITLTYSDMHRQRFAFFQALLREVGADWSSEQARIREGLNAGEAFHVATARFDARDAEEQASQLEGIGARIVFVIDWNRARKRLLAFVDRESAVAVLREAARREAGHVAWLQAGGERLLWNAMAAQGDAVFRLGDRLDDVLGAAAAVQWLVEVLVLASQARLRGQPAALVADEARLMLARRLLGRRSEFELLEEHAGLCHALAQAIRDGLARGVEGDPGAATALAAQAKAWEYQADQLVMQARSRAARQPQWQAFARLIERSDDVADALEEAAFVISLIADGHREGWGQEAGGALRTLADAVLTAVQDHVRALAVASTLGEGSDAADQDDYLAASWRVLNAERRCDELLRSARRALAREARDAASLLLGNELAEALETASDALLALGYGLREQTFRRLGTPP
jgi:uncharacterized protein Yka (UPF0111/DUF47 family)